MAKGLPDYARNGDSGPGFLLNSEDQVATVCVCERAQVGPKGGLVVIGAAGQGEFVVQTPRLGDAVGDQLGEIFCCDGVDRLGQP